MNAAVRPTRQRFWVLSLLCSLAFLTYLDRICIMRTQGEIETDLGFTQLTPADEERLRQEGLAHDSAARAQAARNRATERMSWVFSAFVAGYALFEVPAGWLGDRWGARSVIFRIVLWWSLFTAATGGVKRITGFFWGEAGPVHWVTVLVLIRFLFGAGEAGAYPNMARALGRWFPFGERATAQSCIWLSSRVGGAFAPTIIGFLMVLTGGWQRAFVVLGVIGVLWAIIFRIWYRDRPEEHPKANEAERDLIRGGFIQPGSIYDDTAPARVPWLALFSPNVLALCSASFCVSFCFYFYITFLPKYLKDQFQVDYSQSQFISGLPLLLGGLACVPGGMLSDYAIRKLKSRRWGRSLIPVIGWTAAGACAFAVAQLHSAVAVMVLITGAFAFQDLGVPALWSIPSDIGGRFAATLAGWMNSAGAVGGMLSPLVAAKVSIAYGWNVAFVLFGAVYVLGAVACLGVDAGRPWRAVEVKAKS